MSILSEVRDLTKPPSKLSEHTVDKHHLHNI